MSYFELYECSSEKHHLKGSRLHAITYTVDLTVLHQFYVPRFSDLEQDYACQENVMYEQLAELVATT